MNSLPGFGFGEVVLIVVYVVATHYFVRSRVREEMKSIHDRIDALEKKNDYRLDEQELYIRRVNALAELNQRILVSNPKIRSIVDRLNSTDVNE